MSESIFILIFAKISTIYNSSPMEQLFKRKIYSRILDWKRSEGKSALLIEGARRVGKSTIVKEFAKREYKSFILIDFSNASKEIQELFDDVSDLNFFFLRLQALSGVSLCQRESLIVFDEVQFAPRARQAIKHLVADGRYDYIETGSLISIRKNVKDILIPSEEHRLQMNPMDFEEFQWALGFENIGDLMREFIARRHPLGNATHRKMMRDFRLYMLVGGMPQAVETYIESNDFRRVDDVKRTIVSLYNDDFMKIDPSGRISRLFNAIPSQLYSNASRYMPHSIVEGDSEFVMTAMSELMESRTINIAWHATDPGPMMSANYDASRFKLFTADTGLFVTLAFMDDSYMSNDLYRKLLSDKLEANLGYVYENAVSQILVAQGKKIFYYTFDNPNKTGKYEIDFLVQDHGKVDPIEVKSSGYNQHKSLDAFCTRYSSRIHQAYCVTPKDRSNDNQIINLPFYLLPFLFD